MLSLSALSATVSAEIETNEAYLFHKGNVIELYETNEDGSKTGSGCVMEIIDRELREDDWYYVLQPSDSEYSSVRVEISDSDLWDIGCYIYK